MMILPKADGISVLQNNKVDQDEKIRYDHVLSPGGYPA
jgi:hypothetical protein